MKRSTGCALHSVERTLAMNPIAAGHSAVSPMTQRFPGLVMLQWIGGKILRGNRLVSSIKVVGVSGFNVPIIRFPHDIPMNSHQSLIKPSLDIGVSLTFFHHPILRMLDVSPKPRCMDMFDKPWSPKKYSTTKTPWWTGE